ncbi:hypothetical protein ES695_16765 [Candidatus Atribacteria bacterium 1244-E10-H5-B2]|nr:MAG: hypothetical protein ES695_16765 [Candidatus Atribacteria bacterium 1244-E10-H5-B2]
MKRKVLLLVLVIILVLVSSGCGMTPPGSPDWAMAEQEVYSYWKAIINRQYELAKWYCIIDGIWYNKTDEWKEYINTNSEGEASVIIHLPIFYKQAEAVGNNAVVYAKIFVDKTAFPGSCVIDVDTFEYEIELIKQNYPPGDWMLK